MTFSSDGRKLYLDYTRQPDGHTVVVEYTLGDGTRIDEDSRRELLVRRAALRQPQRRPPRHRPRRLPLHRARRRRRRRRPARPRPGHHDAARLDPAHRPRGRHRGRPRLRHPARQPLRRRRGRARRRSGSTACATRGGSASTPRPATSGSPTSARTSTRRSTCLPANGGFDAGKGDNLGWNEMEGTHAVRGRREPRRAPSCRSSSTAATTGCSVIGGYVYRGEEIPGLQGTYLYADYCGTGVRGLQVDGGTVIDTRTWDLAARRRRTPSARTTPASCTCSWPAAAS